MFFPIGDTFPKYRTPVGVLALIALNVVAFLYQLGLSPRQNFILFTSLGMIPAELTQQVDLGAQSLHPLWLTAFTSMFLHGGFGHLLSNMLFLWAFGNTLEHWLGSVRFLLFYLLAGALAATAHILTNPDSQVPTVGASGAIAGVLGGYFIRFPFSVIRTLVGIPPFFFFVVGIPGLIYLGIWFLLQLQGGFASLGHEGLTNIAFWAHIGGFIAGMALVGAFTPRARRLRR